MLKKLLPLSLIVLALTSCEKAERFSKEEVFNKCLTQARQSGEKSIVLNANFVKACMAEKNHIFNNDCKISEHLVKELPPHSIQLLKELTDFCYADNN